MPEASSLIERVQHGYPQFTFVSSDQFRWQPNETTVFYDLSDPYFESRLLHELSHAVLDHSSYEKDIDLIAMERDAWQHARMTLAPSYEIHIEADIIHHDMDTYRNWLHERSTCPHCGSNGIQMKKSTYQCVTCRKQWRVNEARTCALRRYK